MVGWNAATLRGGIVGKQESEGDLARPDWSQDFLDDAQPFIGVDETVGSGQDPDMLGDGAWSHPEQDKRAGPRLCGRDFLHHLARAFCQHLAGASLAPIPTVRWDRKWFIPDDFAPDTPRKAEAIAADTA